VDANRDIELLETFVWQAGVADGEGCLTIGRQIRKNRPSPAVSPVGHDQQHPDVLVPFILMWGGRLYRSREHRRGWSDAYTWCCPNAQA
jgi:hypothetical protein